MCTFYLFGVRNIVLVFGFAFTLLKEREGSERTKAAAAAAQVIILGTWKWKQVLCNQLTALRKGENGDRDGTGVVMKEWKTTRTTSSDCIICDERLLLYSGKMEKEGHVTTPPSSS